MRTFACIAVVSLLGCAGGAPSGPAPDITGVWAVTMRYEDGSCPDVMAGSQASMWTVNRDATGAYAIAVQGDDKMPALMGKEDGAYLVLVGLTESYPVLSTQWRVSGSGSDLKGRALQTRLAPKAYTLKGKYGDSTKDVMCTVIWTVEATKQGK